MWIRGLSRDREIERKQSQTGTFVSRLEPLLDIPTFTAMKNFHYSWSRKITTLQVLTRTTRPVSPSYVVTQHFKLACNLYNTNTMKEWSSSRSPNSLQCNSITKIRICSSEIDVNTALKNVEWRNKAREILFWILAQKGFFWKSSIKT